MERGSPKRLAQKRSHICRKLTWNVIEISRGLLQLNLLFMDFRAYLVYFAPNSISTARLASPKQKEEARIPRTTIT